MSEEARTGTSLDAPAEGSALRHPVVGAHQPNFFPWLGYFHKIRWSDTFVILDDVPMQKRQAGTVTNRVAFFANGKELFVTAPIARPKTDALVPLHDLDIAPEPDFREKFVVFLKHTYARAAFFKELSEEIFALVRHPEPKLAAYNEHAIRHLAARLALTTPLVKSSTLAVTTMSTQRLIDLVQRLGGKTYLSGAGAGGYQVEEAYAAAGLDIILQQFKSTSYPRGKEPPAPGLSILDALFHLGVEKTRALIDEPLDLSRLHRAPGA